VLALLQEGLGCLCHRWCRGRDPGKGPDGRGCYRHQATRRRIFCRPFRSGLSPSVLSLAHASALTRINPGVSQAAACNQARGREG
jgi:hypothetical protein